MNNRNGADRSLPALVVIAKEPRPGLSKTRLCPPCAPEQAADLARAALADTLDAVAAAPADRRVLVLDGEPGNWIPEGFEVIAQVEGGLDRRLAAAFDAVAEPALLVGMDTPQLSPELLEACAAELMRDGVDAVLGLAPDGGYWAIGLHTSEPELFEGVPMSTSQTGERQRDRLTDGGLAVSMLPELHDVDTFDEAITVAAQCEHSRFAAELERVRSEHAGSEGMVAAWDAE